MAGEGASDSLLCSKYHVMPGWKDVLTDEEGQAKGTYVSPIIAEGNKLGQTLSTIYSDSRGHRIYFPKERGVGFCCTSLINFA